MARGIRQDKRLFKTGKEPWERIRKLVLNKEPLCRQCKKEGRVTAAVDVDHINGSAVKKEDYELTNLQPLCKSCHSRKTAAAAGCFGREKAGRLRGCDENGVPLDGRVK